MRILFCNIAWMKHYIGHCNEDQPINGGSYIKKHQTGGEIYNFLGRNHICYGYVMHNGDIHIERIDPAGRNADELRDVLVVWVAKDNTNSKIVGWYDNATVYREWQKIYDPFIYDQAPEHDYNIVAKDTDTHLIPVNDRSFHIPRAMASGAGQGMGQAQIWFADSEYGQTVFIPQVLEYIESMRNKTNNPWYTFSAQELSEIAIDKHQSVEDLIAQAYKNADEYDCFLDAFSYANLAIEKEDSSRTKELKGYLYYKMGYYDEAEPLYEETMEMVQKNLMSLLWKYLRIEWMLFHPEKVKQTISEIFSIKGKVDNQKWEAIAWDIMEAAIYTKDHTYAKEIYDLLKKDDYIKKSRFMKDAKSKLEI